MQRIEAIKARRERAYTRARLVHGVIPKPGQVHSLESVAQSVVNKSEEEKAAEKIKERRKRMNEIRRDLSLVQAGRWNELDKPQEEMEIEKKEENAVKVPILASRRSKRSVRMEVDA